jgi:hypothetical protein
LKPLFPHNLTPQKKRLLQRTLQSIYSQTLETSDLQLSLLYFRELKIDDEFWEWGSAIAHGKRNQGLLWSWALNVWTTHLYYKNLSEDSLNVQALPYDVYKTILFLIDNTAEWQLAQDLRDIYPNGITKDDLLATIEHLYSRSRKSKETFVFLTSEKGNFEEDLQLMRYLVSYCEEMALQIPPARMDDLVDALETGFTRIDLSRRSFSRADRIYLQLHLLVSFHNLLFDLNCEFFKKLTGFDAPEVETMLSVSAMDDTLGLDVAFYQRQDGRYLEQANVRSPDRLERFRTPLITTDLEEKRYLLESDPNIRGCLFNHPLEVRRHRGNPVIVALNRKSARFKPTRFRAGSAAD